MDCIPRLFPSMGIPGKNTREGVAISFSRDLSNPATVEHRSPTLQVVLYRLSHQSKRIDTPICITESLLYVGCVSAAKSCLTLQPTDYTLLGSSVHGIFFQARKLDWVATVLLQGIFLFQGSNPVTCVSCIARGLLYPVEMPGKPPLFCKPKLIQHFKSTILF